MDTSTPPERLNHPLQGPTLLIDLASVRDELERESPLPAGAHTAKTLVKQPDMRIVLVVMKAGSVLKEHQAEARISVQTLSGRVRFRAAGESIELPTGKLLVVDKKVPHEVEALEDSTFLLSLFRQES
jgi:quercetin dioxygenase-like cupin family protein